MATAGALNGMELVPVVRGGVINNFITTTAAIAALAPGGSGGSSGLVTTDSLTSDYGVLISDSGTYFDNGNASGLVIATLPAPLPGLNYHFTVTSAQIFQILAPSGASIALGTNNSVLGGSVSSNFLFSSIFVYAPSGMSNQWIATSDTGGWGVD